MRTTHKPTTQPAKLRRAFTVTELMVAIGLMSLIILVLYSVFNQTQKAMRHNESQNDISEKSRAVLELVTRELEQMVASRASAQENLNISPAQLPEFTTTYTNPLDNSIQTNVLNDLFFLTRTATNWGAIGYRVLNSRDGVGTLIRFSPEPQHLLPSSNFFLKQFQTITTDSTSASNMHYVAEGLVHFKIIPVDQDGRRFSWNTTNLLLSSQNLLVLTNASPKRYTQPNRYTPPFVARTSTTGKIIKDTGFNGTTVTNLADANIIIGQLLDEGPESRATFRSNALPAYVQVEIGLLEPDVVRQYNQMVADSNPRAGSYVRARLNRTQLYRQLVTIRQFTP